MYCTSDEMIKRFERNELITLTDKDGATGAIVMDVLNQAIADATGVIDGYLTGVVRLPLRTPPVILNRLCADMARYYLYDDNLDENHQAARRFSEAMRYLENVAQRKIRLDLPETQSSSNAINLVNFSSAGSVFSRDKAKGFL